MNRLQKISLGIVILISASITNASNNCFIAKEGDKIVKQQGRCDTRHPPYSSFKIAIALLGFDANILKSPEEPIVKVSDEIKRSLESDDALKKYQLPYYGRTAPKLLLLG